MSVSTEVFILAITYIIIFLTVYKSEKYTGNLILIALGALTFTLLNIPVAISWILTIIPFINLIFCFLNEPNKKEEY